MKIFTPLFSIVFLISACSSQAEKEDSQLGADTIANSQDSFIDTSGSTNPKLLPPPPPISPQPPHVVDKPPASEAHPEFISQPVESIRPQEIEDPNTGLKSNKPLLPDEVKK